MFASFIGQEEAIAPLRTAVEAAKRSGRRLPHAVLLGSPGVGKTTLARAVAEEMGQPFAVIHAPTIADARDLSNRILAADGGVVLLDEAHSLRREHAEAVYSVLDAGTLTIHVPIMGHGWGYEWIESAEGMPEGAASRWNGPGMYEVPVVTVPTRETEPQVVDVAVSIIAATTDPALLAPAFLSRLGGLTIRLRPYTTVELATIAVLHADTLAVELDHAAAVYIAARARGTPRRAKQLTERTCDQAIAEGRGKAALHHAQSALAALGIDRYGLDASHRHVLRVLSEHERGLSRSSLAQILALPVRSVDLAWGDLAAAGMVEITNRHQISRAGREALEPRP